MITFHKRSPILDRIDRDARMMPLVQTITETLAFIAWIVVIALLLRNGP